MPNTVVRVEELRKSYGPITAVDGISFEVYEGEIFGVVGPNGAGKTTALECIEGLRRPDSGRIEVLGLDHRRDEYELRERIGVQLQESALNARIKVWEALDLFAAFYRRSVPWRPLLDQLGLTEKMKAPFAKLSGGQKQRLFIALSLVNDPELVFLDELTTGLDPHARRSMWDLLLEIRKRGKTIVLSTHFMEEAERLCDRVAIIDRGRIVALDSPRNLVRGLGGDSRLSFTVEGHCEIGLLNDLSSVTRVDAKGEQLTVYGSGSEMAAQVTGALATNGVRFRDLKTEQATLEDVFLALTGREMRD